MARLAKNPNLKHADSIAASVKLPDGTTAQRSTDSKTGAARFNTTIGAMEFFNGTIWESIAIAGLITITKNSFVGDASTTAFVMTISVVDETDILVFVGGVFQNPGVAYTNDGSTTITFTSPPPNLEAIVVLHGYNSTV